MYTKGKFTDLYNKTKDIDETNKKITLKENNENQNIPYKQFSQIQLRLLDCPGEIRLENINKKIYAEMKALIIVFDITNKNSFKSIRTNIAICKNNFNKSKKKNTNLEDNIIKQPESFTDIPILIVGNKSDLNTNRKIEKNEIDEFITNLNKDKAYSFLKYYEISVKNNTGIDPIFQDIIFYYFKRTFDNDVIIQNNNNQNVINEIIEENKENNIKDKKDAKNKIKKPSLDKNIFIFHQMLDKVKKKFYSEISTLKEENKKEIEKNKKMEEKIELISNDFNNENKILKEKLNIFENKTNKLEQQLKLKNEEIDNLKKQVNELMLLNKEITLKFKISNENDEVTINTKGEAKISEVLSMLYELCPNINNMEIKGFCLEGKEDEKIDEMKTVNENKLVNGSLIVLMV